MQWYIHQEDTIMGPYSTEQVLASLKSGEVSYSSHIWSQGQIEWFPLTTWEEQLPNLVRSAQAAIEMWKVKLPDKAPQTNLDFESAVNLIKPVKDLSQVKISAQNSEKWSDIYSVLPFMEALELSRRSYHRAPLMGLAKVSRQDSRFSYVVKTSSIGGGGIGIYGLSPSFTPEHPVEIRIESEDLSSSLVLSGHIRYQTPQGFVGIEFSNVKDDQLQVITDYVDRFQDPTELINKKAS